VLSSSAPLRSSGSPSADSAVETNADVQAIVAEQAALRRVATLAAHAVSNERLFAAVNEELARLVGADAAALLRLEPDETVTLLAAWNAAGAAVTVDDQQPVNAALRRLRDSARPMRCGPADVPLTGPFIGEIRRLGIRATVAVPIQVDGQVWGVSVAASRSPEPFPAATEARMLEFAELVAIAISNAQSHAELAASRARLIAAVSRVRPRALCDGGLHEAINALLQDIGLPASVEITRDRLSPHVETTAYFVIAEALTNAVKHAKARRLAVRATVRDGALELEIRDDGVGGAQIHHGTGLVGLVDRVESIGGRIAITGASGAGTTVAVSLPTD
jgi:signal transduction histidine kinase